MQVKLAKLEAAMENVVREDKGARDIAAYEKANKNGSRKLSRASRRQPA